MLGNATITALVGITDAARARAFYEDALGLRFVEDQPYALIFDANGITLRAAKVERAQPPPYTSLGWRVDDIAATVQALAANGVVFERYPGMDQDELNIWHAEGGAVAWFKDPDGNLLSLSQDGAVTR